MGAVWFCDRRRQDPEARSLIVANDFPQLARSTLVVLTEVCLSLGIPLDPTCDRPEETARIIAARGFCRIWGAYVYVISASNFSGGSESGRGIQIRDIWGDELSYSDKGVLDTLNGRLGRGPGHLRGQGVITSSINKHDPYNFMYELFDAPKRSPEQQSIYQSVKVSCYENPHLDPDFIPSLKAAYTPELFAIEVEGIYAATTEGRIFKYFNRASHALFDDAARDYNLEKPLHITFDFNASPACALLCQVQDDNLFVLREWYLKDSDTFELSDHVTDYLLDLNYKQDIYIYGDASGNQKTANSRQTNWAIVWAALKKKEIFAWQRYGESNPSVLDSVNSVNIRFRRDAVKINGDRCPELLRDLETLKWKGDKIDKTDLMRSHLADCLRYLIDAIWPYANIASIWDT